MIIFYSFLILSLIVVCLSTLFAIFTASSFVNSVRTRLNGIPSDLGIPFEDVLFHTEDEVALSGWYLENSTSRTTIIIIHDRDRDRSDNKMGLLNLQVDYAKQGFSVLSFDLRGCGESTGKRGHLGQLENLDVEAAVLYARRRKVQDSIVLHGFGLGATLAIEVGAKNLDITAIVADAPMDSLSYTLRETYLWMPGFIFRMSSYFSKIIYKSDPYYFQLMEKVKNIRIPIFFVHSEYDEIVPVWNSINLCASSTNPHHYLWMHENHTGHCSYYLDSPVEYFLRIKDFISKFAPIPIHVVRDSTQNHIEQKVS